MVLLHEEAVEEMIIQWTLWFVILFLFAFVISMMVKIIKTYGLERTLIMLWRGSGMINFYPESVCRTFTSWKRGEGYDRGEHLKQWTGENFPDREEDCEEEKKEN